MVAVAEKIGVTVERTGHGRLDKIMSRVMERGAIRVGKTPITLDECEVELWDEARGLLFPVIVVAPSGVEVDLSRTSEGAGMEGWARLVWKKEGDKANEIKLVMGRRLGQASLEVVHLRQHIGGADEYGVVYGLARETNKKMVRGLSQVFVKPAVVVFVGSKLRLDKEVGGELVDAVMVERNQY